MIVELIDASWIWDPPLPRSILPIHQRILFNAAPSSYKDESCPGLLITELLSGDGPYRRDANQYVKRPSGRSPFFP